MLCCYVFFSFFIWEHSRILWNFMFNWHISHGYSISNYFYHTTWKNFQIYRTYGWIQFSIQPTNNCILYVIAQIKSYYFITGWSKSILYTLTGLYDNNNICMNKIRLDIFSVYPEISFGNIESQKITEISFYNRYNRNINNNRNILPKMLKMDFFLYWTQSWALILSFKTHFITKCSGKHSQIWKKL